jgi:hypothetical protein
MLCEVEGKLRRLRTEIRIVADSSTIAYSGIPEHDA